MPVPTAVVHGNGVADSTAILAAFDALKVGGHATGTLIIRGDAAVDVPLDLDGGYPDLQNPARWTPPAVEQFRLIVEGSLTPAPGLGNAVSVHGFVGATLDLTFRGGGAPDDNALDLHNLVQADVTVKAVGFAGTVLHGDTYIGAANDQTRRIRGSRISRLYANSCGRTLFWRGFEAFGVIEDVWDNNCVTGSYIGFCADHRLGHYETFNPTSQTVGLTLEGCNQFNGGVIAMGDRASDVLLRIIGNTTDPAGARASSDFGSLERVRATCYMPGGKQAYRAIELVDVHYIEIDNVWTGRSVTGLHLIGSNARIKSHYSMTGDVNALVVDGDAFNPAPIVEVGARYRYTQADPVILGPSLTGGVVKVSGQIESSVATGGTKDVWAINSASSGALDVTGLTQDPKRGLGFTNHRSEIRGTALH